jgi:tetratricopeptide (TPR) repeat protein
MPLPEATILNGILAALTTVAVLGWVYPVAANEVLAVTVHATDATNAVPPSANLLLEAEQKIFAQYGGSESCQDCHAEEYALWKKSNHGQAERLVQPARDREDFDPPQTFMHDSQTSIAGWSNGVAIVTAIGLSRKPEAHAIARVIGNDPLLQYLVPFPGGRFQILEASYDPHSNQWFNANGEEDRQPGEWGHWTGRGANWNFMCASCHNTRLQKNYDEASDSYHTTMAEMTVGCEACHGPLRAHNDWQKKFGKSGAKDPTLVKLNHQEVLDNCGECHSRRAELTGDFVPGEDFSDEYDLDMVDGSDLYYTDGQIREEDYEYASFLGSRMHAAGVYCLNCHNPHTAKIRLPGNWICLQCHGGGNTNAPAIDPVAHSHHKVRGYNADGKLIEADLTKYNSKNFPETGGECVNCHMPQTPYMQRHWRHDHGFTSPDPLLTRELGLPNACNRCHQDKSVDWALDATQKWYGTNMDRLLGTRRERTRAIARARAGDPAAIAPLLKLLAGNENPYWRAAIVNQLEPWSAYPAVQTVLLKSLNDTNSLVRAKAAHVLDATAQPLDANVVLTLRSRLDDPVRAVRIAAAWSLRGELDLSSRAGKELNFFLDENADEPAGQMQKGEFFIGRHDLTNALAHYRQAVAWDAHSAPIHRELALTCNLLDQSRNALDELTEAVRLDPRDSEYRYELALALNEAGYLTATVTELEKAVQLNPNHAQAWYNLGLAREKKHDSSGALAALEHAEEHEADNPQIPYARATILLRLGRTAEARIAIQRALQLLPDFPAARNLSSQLAR